MAGGAPKFAVLVAAHLKCLETIQLAGGVVLIIAGAETLALIQGSAASSALSLALPLLAGL